MKEFIEKLIERLAENRRPIVTNDEDLEWNRAMYLCTGIVNQLAEEYKHCALCYLGSPCEYQNENAILPNELLADKNGWIPCSERLPSREETEEWATFLVTIRVNEKYDIMDFCLFGTDGKWLVSEGREVIAWKRQMPYQPKGE